MATHESLGVQLAGDAKNLEQRELTYSSHPSNDYMADSTSVDTNSVLCSARMRSAGKEESARRPPDVEDEKTENARARRSGGTLTRTAEVMSSEHGPCLLSRRGSASDEVRCMSCWRG